MSGPNWGPYRVMTVLLAVAGCRFASATSSLEQVFVLGHLRVRRLVDVAPPRKNADWRARQPMWGPNALEVQVKDVPLSSMILLNS